jgi:hydrogenase nickel incorporation protein HypA/HybF
MHEHGLINSLMRRIDAIAAAERARKVVGVRVWLGALSQMSPAHFEEHFRHAAAGTIADGATLDCATSDDIHDPRATEVVLLDLEVDA